MAILTAPMVHSAAIAALNAAKPIGEAAAKVAVNAFAILGFALVWYNLGIEFPPLDNFVIAVLDTTAWATEWVSPGNSIDDVMVAGLEP